jgi:hypothetical protein
MASEKRVQPLIEGGVPTGVLTRLMRGSTSYHPRVRATFGLEAEIASNEVIRKVVVKLWISLRLGLEELRHHAKSLSGTQVIAFLVWNG